MQNRLFTPHRRQKHLSIQLDFAVSEEVLPSIRKTGSYSVNETPSTLLKTSEFDHLTILERSVTLVQNLGAIDDWLTIDMTDYHKRNVLRLTSQTVDRADDLLSLDEYFDGTCSLCRS